MPQLLHFRFCDFQIVLEKLYSDSAGYYIFNVMHFVIKIYSYIYLVYLGQQITLMSM